MHLVGGITGAAASLIVDTVTGLPTVPFTLLLDPGVSTEEVVEVTAAGGTTLTVTRGVDGTSAQAHLNGAEVRHAYSARDFQDSRNHEANLTTAHGVTGAVVGTANVQALTNKTLDGSLNTFSNVPQAALPATSLSTTGAQILTNKVIDGAVNTLTNTTPAGSITMFGGAVAPTGYLNCDGASVLNATYPALFAAIGSAYGSVDGTHFTLPNLSAAFPRGGTPGGVGGAATHTLTTTEMPSHSHTQDAHNHTQDAHSHPISTYANAPGADGARVSANNVTGIGVSAGTSSTQTTAATNQATTATNQVTGGGAAFATLPPYVGVNFIIKT